MKPRVNLGPPALTNKSPSSLDHHHQVDGRCSCHAPARYRTVQGMEAAAGPQISKYHLKRNTMVPRLPFRKLVLTRKRSYIGSQGPRYKTLSCHRQPRQIWTIDDPGRPPGCQSRLRHLSAALPRAQSHVPPLSSNDGSRRVSMTEILITTIDTAVISRLGSWGPHTTRRWLSFAPQPADTCHPTKASVRKRFDTYRYNMYNTRTGRLSVLLGAARLRRDANISPHLEVVTTRRRHHVNKSC